MEKSRIFQIAMVFWLLLFVGFAVYKLINAPIMCWDGAEVDPETGELRPIGGCDPQYGQAIAEMIPPFVVWLVVFIALGVFYLKLKR